MHAGLYLVHAHPSKSVGNGSHHTISSTWIAVTDNYFKSTTWQFLFFPPWGVFTYQANARYPHSSSGLSSKILVVSWYRVLYLMYNTALPCQYDNYHRYNDVNQNIFHETFHVNKIYLYQAIVAEITRMKHIKMINIPATVGRPSMDVNGECIQIPINSAMV